MLQRPHPLLRVVLHLPVAPKVLVCHRDGWKAPERFPFSLTLLQTFPDQAESAPCPMGASQVSGSSVVAKTQLNPVLCPGSCPFNSFEQLICLSLSQSFPSSWCPSYPNPPAILCPPPHSASMGRGCPFYRFLPEATWLPSKWFFKGPWL